MQIRWQARMPVAEYALGQAGTFHLPVLASCFVVFSVFRLTKATTPLSVWLFSSVQSGFHSSFHRRDRFPFVFRFFFCRLRFLLSSMNAWVGRPQSETEAETNKTGPLTKEIHGTTLESFQCFVLGFPVPFSIPPTFPFLMASLVPVVLLLQQTQVNHACHAPIC